MPVYKKSIHRSLLSGVAAFISLSCFLLSIQSYLMVSRALYARYEEQLSNALAFLEHNIDANDMQRCVQTGVATEKHGEAQRLVNVMADDFGLTYIYLCIPMDDGLGTMFNVVSSTSAVERAAGEEDLPLLYSTSDAYTAEELLPYLAAWRNPGEVTFFETGSSRWGNAYIACKPLIASDGETVALMCADIAIDELHALVRSYVFYNVLLIITIGVLFGLLSFMWLRKDVTGPVVALEKSARRFAEKSHGKKDPALLVFDVPDIHTQNEVESLSDAITQMSKDMKNYVEDILAAEKRMHAAEKEAEGMTRIAYQDALTHMKSKAAYDAKIAELDRKIVNGNAEFAIVMLDLNNLKKINDTYGHEHGNEYIIGACDIISDVYKHSPIFRVGGDEFVVILQGRDYDRREALFGDMNDRFAAAWENEQKQPWERFSAAAGMAEYTGEEGETATQVFRRADACMYENKKAMKAAR